MTEDTPVKLVFHLPDKSEPGYLLRMRRALELNQRINDGSPSAQLIDDLVEFLLDYVREPSNREQARQALYMASEEQILSVFEALRGGGADVIPPQSGAPS